MKRWMKLWWVFRFFPHVCIGFLATLSIAQTPAVVMASTTSTEQSGLFGHLLPAFTRATGIEVKVVAVGTGQAIDMGRRGDADLLFVHDQPAEEKLVSDGFALRRYPVMYNDVVLVGPITDPAGVSGQDIALAMAKLAGASSVAGFISRGDKSGTHSAELRYWQAAGIKQPAFAGYKACGCGMGQALNMAASLNAYVLADRGSWLAFKNRAGLAVLVEGDKRLLNQYGVMVVNSAKHPHTRAVDAQKFVDWVVSPQGQAVIAGYRINGEALFFPNAAK